MPDLKVRVRAPRSLTPRLCFRNVSHLFLRLVLGGEMFVLFVGGGRGAAVAEPKPIQPSASSSPREADGATKPGQGNPILYTYEVVKTWPHDRQAFTQGLVFQDGQLLESTGLNGQSSLRRVDLKTGLVIKQVEVPPQYFAEGLAVLDGKAFQLTWQNHKGFVYDLKSLRLERDFSYEGEGWGLTTDGRFLIMSDGTARIRFLDPATFEVKRSFNVSHRTWPVDRLNELEYIKGEIFANIWGADYVVRIDSGSGVVTGVINFAGLLSASDRAMDTDVLNGIAYDPVGDRLFVTGKRWPKVYEVRLKPK